MFNKQMLQSKKMLGGIASNPNPNGIASIVASNSASTSPPSLPPLASTLSLSPKARLVMSPDVIKVSVSFRVRVKLRVRVGLELDLQ
jgi:hypothetical protein